MSDNNNYTWRDHSRLFLACGIVILSPFQYGFDFGMIGGLQAMKGFLQIFGYRTDKTPTGWNISPERQQLISSLMTLGAFLSSATAGVPSTRFGRRTCLAAACITCFIANILMMATEHIAALYTGRLVIGLANGYFMTFSQLYLQESSTAELRGIFLTGFNFFVSFGTLIGTIVDWATAKRPDKTYKAYFLQMAKVQDPFAMSNILSAISIIAFIANSCIVVRYGNRRVLLMTGLLFCGVLQLIIALVYHKAPDAKATGKVTVGLTGIYMFSYNGMISTYAWLSGGELPTQRLRSHTFGLAASAGFVGAWLTTFTAPYFINPQAMDWGPRYGFIWAPSCAVAAAWVFFFLPEVKNRTLEEIDEMFAAGLGARRFNGYKCIGVGGEEEGKGKERTSVEKEKEVVVLMNEHVAAETTVSRD
ncbi:sugar transport protein 4 [Pyrenophora tritici-repentis]|nr:sugar transport protein 4 [Pyrenophora tritici-repentis]KAI1525619.1 AraJ Arabinose efflux permease [Pyrenophora tritici-repentis]KAI1600643.1 AraJ Arabinose efflux permease [Pyrenophora tritici-repentis]PWO20879.1 MAGE-domain-containing protein [Pyrenophora tritici-repentis]PZD33579.1 sugar transport protein 4 [Pyrenophora tritici-repentis]